MPHHGSKTDASRCKPSKAPAQIQAPLQYPLKPIHPESEDASTGGEYQHNPLKT